MSTPFIAEIKIAAFGYPPRGWALCNGQTMPINQNQALFALLGTTYGGNGQTTFALPNLQGRTPLHFGAAHALGEAGGSSAVTLTTAELPTHQHQLRAQTEQVAADEGPQNPEGRLYAQPKVALQGGGTAPVQLYAAPVSLQAVALQSVAVAGGSQPHNNMMPYLTLNFIIALQGIFPSQN